MTCCLSLSRHPLRYYYVLDPALRARDTAISDIVAGVNGRDTEQIRAVKCFWCWNMRRRGGICFSWGGEVMEAFPGWGH